MISQRDDASELKVDVSSATEDLNCKTTSSDFSIYTSMYPSVALQKWAGVFDGQGLCLPDLKPEARAAYLSSGWSDEAQCNSRLTQPNVKTKLIGTPIDLEKARALRRILFGDATRTFTKDWEQCHFTFRDSESTIPYGLKANLGGPTSLILCVNSYVIKHILFNLPEEEEKILGREPPNATPSEQTSALIDALSDILWKLATPAGHSDANDEEREVIICMPGTVQCFETLGYLLADGLIEKLWLYTFNKLDDVREFIRENLDFFCKGGMPGAIIYVYSLVLTHTTQAVIEELGNCQRSILTENARPTQAFHNLILNGSASCFLHNGTIRYDRLGNDLPTPLVGLRKRSEIGFLFFDKTEEDSKRTEVGCMLRTPLLPIWITKVNGSYGMIFCTSRDLVADWKTERFFSVHYYTGHDAQQKPTCISIDTRRRAFPDPIMEISYWDDEEEKERKQPSLERLLETKWHDAIIDWNGETPYY